MSKTGWKKVDKENPEWNDIDIMLTLTWTTLWPL